MISDNPTRPSGRSLWRVITEPLTWRDLAFAVLVEAALYAWWVLAPSDQERGFAGTCVVIISIGIALLLMLPLGAQACRWRQARRQQ